MPRASIVIPCYNAEAYISQTIDSACAQTVSDIEIIVVDDGSTDSTPRILAQKAEADSRIHVYKQNNAGEGPAREAGRVRACGTWLYFLDADDIMEPTLIEDAMAQGERTRADIVIFKTRELDNQTGELRSFPWSFVTDWLEVPAGTQGFQGKCGIDRIVIGDMSGVFCPREHPLRIFNSFQNWVHNKLFRKSFVDGRKLQFQPIHRTADLLFVCRALAEADRIALVDKELHRYRVNNALSALNSSDAWPLDFYEAFLALRKSLEEHGLWLLYHDSFINWVQEGVAMNLQRARSFDAFMAIVHCMRDERGLIKLDFLTATKTGAINPDRWERCCAILNAPIEELLYMYFARERRQAELYATQASALRRECKKLANSREQRVGEAMIPLIDKPLTRTIINTFHLGKRVGMRHTEQE